MTDIVYILFGFECFCLKIELYDLFSEFTRRSNSLCLGAVKVSAPQSKVIIS